MAAEDRRLPLGDRILRSQRNWLTQFALRHRCTRADVLGRYLSSGCTVEAGGNDPLRVLELCIALQKAGVDPERVLAVRCEPGSHAR